MTDAEWEAVRPLLPVPAWLRGRGGQPEAYCHRAILDAIRYLVCVLPPLARPLAGQEFHDRLRDRVRQMMGRDAQPTAGVIDLQSVKADAVVGSDSRGFDGGKLVNGLSGTS
ncbi:transposase [Streptomyces sp. NRRL S-1448]|uniref:transposase n=1 Tax=Streptomyces sp. NRRL S-1448 TaxID=1463883 RepID=UPI000A631820|nr:transposase [Streptomyces sp. NRRL S-1448]